MKSETKQAVTRAVHELRQRISCIEREARFSGYTEVHQQLIWLELDARKYRDELYTIENQEVLPIDAASKIPNRMRA